MGTYTPLGPEHAVQCRVGRLRRPRATRRTKLSRLAFCDWQRCGALSDRLRWRAIRRGNSGRPSGDLDDCGTSPVGVADCRQWAAGDAGG